MDNQLLAGKVAVITGAGRGIGKVTAKLFAQEGAKVLVARKVPRELMPEMTGKAALRRGRRPEEQAHVAAFLCSDRASFVTGTIIPVDGGWSARLA